MHGVWHLCKQVFQPRTIALHTTIPLHFLVLSQKQHFWCHPTSIGLRYGDWAGHSITLILLVWNQHVAHLLVCLGSLSCWNTHFKGISSSANRIHYLFEYVNVLKLIHDPWNAIHRPNTYYEKHPHIMMLAPPCFTVYYGLNSVLGGRLTNCLRPLDPKRTILLHQSTKYCAISLQASQCVV